MLLPIEIKVQLTQEDFVKGMRVFNIRYREALVTFLGAAVVFLFLGIWLINQDSMLSVISFLAIPLLLLNNLVWRPYIYGAQAIKNEHLTAPIKMTIDENGVKIGNNYKYQQIEWKNYQQLIEGKGHFLLKTVLHRNSFDIIPKSAFDSQEQEEAFRQFVSTKIKEAVM